MMVLNFGMMSDGTKVERVHSGAFYLRIPFGRCLLAYPKPKSTLPGTAITWEGEGVKVLFTFCSEELAKDAFKLLISGDKKLADYKPFLWNRAQTEYI